MHVAIISEKQFVVLGGPGAAAFYKAVGNIHGAQKIDGKFLLRICRMQTSKVAFPQEYKENLLRDLVLQKGKFILVKDEFISDFQGEKEQRYMKIVSFLNMGIPFNQAELLSIQAINSISTGGVKRLNRL